LGEKVYYGGSTNLYLETDQKRYDCYTEKFKYPYSKKFTGRSAGFKTGDLKCVNGDDIILIDNTSKTENKGSKNRKKFVPEYTFTLWVNEKEFITKALCLDKGEDKKDGVIPVKKDPVYYDYYQLPEINCQFVKYEMQCSPEDMKRTFFVDYKIVGFDKKFRFVQTSIDFIVER